MWGMCDVARMILTGIPSDNSNGMIKISTRVYVAPPELLTWRKRKPRAEARGYQNAAAPQPIAGLPSIRCETATFSLAWYEEAICQGYGDGLICLATTPASWKFLGNSGPRGSRRSRSEYPEGNERPGSLTSLTLRASTKRRHGSFGYRPRWGQ